MVSNLAIGAHWHKSSIDYLIATQLTINSIEIPFFGFNCTMATVLFWLPGDLSILCSATGHFVRGHME
jgi:hypothetical protein